DHLYGRSASNQCPYIVRDVVGVDGFLLERLRKARESLLIDACGFSVKPPLRKLRRYRQLTCRRRVLLGCQRLPHGLNRVVPPPLLNLDSCYLNEPERIASRKHPSFPEGRYSFVITTLAG